MGVLLLGNCLSAGGMGGIGTRNHDGSQSLIPPLVFDTCLGYFVTVVGTRAYKQ